MTIPPSSPSPSLPDEPPAARAAASPSRPGAPRPASPWHPGTRQKPLTEAERTALIETEQARANGLCDQALAHTPEAYRSFVILIAQRKNLGTRETPVWAHIQLPYMTVDGRVKMARDEHKAAGKQIDVPAESGFVEDPISKQLLARVTVKSELYGIAVAHARVFIGGSGPNDTNPLEVAETSAVGRALGFLGYGCFGTGIASADEVLRAQRPDGAESQTPSGPPPSAPAPAAPHGEEIERLVKTLNLPPGKLDLLRAQVPDDATLLARLGELAGVVAPKKSPTYQRGDFLRLANELDVPTLAYLAFLRKEYGVGHPGDLTDEHVARESERFGLRKHDPRSAKKFRAVCQRLGSTTPL